MNNKMLGRSMIPDNASPERACYPIDSTDNELLHQVKENHSDSWQKLVATYTPLIYQLVRKSGIQPSDAADITQNVLLELTNSLGKFNRKNRGAFRKWLKVVTTNKIADFYRKQPKDVSIESESFLSVNRHQPQNGRKTREEESDSGLEHINERQILMQSILKEVQQQVNPQTWQAFEMMFAGISTSEEIGQELGMSAAAVRMAKKRVLTQIRLRWKSDQHHH